MAKKKAKKSSKTSGALNTLLSGASLKHNKSMGRGSSKKIHIAEKESNEEFQNISTKLIDPNPSQPRTQFCEEEIDALAQSIHELGLQEPILVRPMKKRFELIAGERRLRACKKLGFDTIPVLVRCVDDNLALEITIVENLQREDLNPIEEARGFRKLMETANYTQEQAGKRLGINRATLANLLRLLTLTEDLQDFVLKGHLSAGHARALLSLQRVDDRRKLAGIVIKEKLSVRETERLASKSSAEIFSREEKVEKGRSTDDVTREINKRNLEGLLSRALATKVAIKEAKNGGKIVLSYKTPEEFERLYEILKPE